MTKRHKHDMQQASLALCLIHRFFGKENIGTNIYPYPKSVDDKVFLVYTDFILLLKVK